MFFSSQYGAASGITTGLHPVNEKGHPESRCKYRSGGEGHVWFVFLFK